MSVHAKCLRYFHEIVEVSNKNPLQGKRLIEYGNLHSKQTARDLMTQWGYERQGPMKEYFKQLGILDYSIDINGQDGAMLVDLSKPLLGQPGFDKSLIGSFDILFDAGTSEHIEDQYNVWQNTYNLLNINGISIHILPMAGSYNKHGTWKYSLDWVLWFTKACNLQPIDFRIMGNHYMHYGESKLQVCFAFAKTKIISFLPKVQWKDPMYDERGQRGDIERYGGNLEKVRSNVS